MSTCNISQHSKYSIHISQTRVHISLRERSQLLKSTWEEGMGKQKSGKHKKGKYGEKGRKRKKVKSSTVSLSLTEVTGWLWRLPVLGGFIIFHRLGITGASSAQRCETHWSGSSAALSDKDNPSRPHPRATQRRSPGGSQAWRTPGAA